MPDETADIGHYISILKNRKKYFIIPALVVLVVAILVARLLPSIYESSSTILIEEQQIPQEFVKSTVTGFADQRIQSLTQQILSRVKLWEIIQQFNLYADMRKKLPGKKSSNTCAMISSSIRSAPRWHGKRKKRGGISQR